MSLSEQRQPSLQQQQHLLLRRPLGFSRRNRPPRAQQLQAQRQQALYIHCTRDAAGTPTAADRGGRSMNSPSTYCSRRSAGRGSSESASLSSCGPYETAPRDAPLTRMQPASRLPSSAIATAAEADRLQHRQAALGGSAQELSVQLLSPPEPFLR
ncbi:hypothetical protein cyc_09478, partial [Cyclospora cayetanensis]